MTEAEWLACEDPARMIAAVWEGMSLRKRRLFAVAGARVSWRLLHDQRSRDAVEVAERCADHEGPEELKAAHGGAQQAQYDIWEEAGGGAAHGRFPKRWYASLWAMWAAGDMAGLDQYQADGLARRGVPSAAQPALLRDIVRCPASAVPSPVRPGEDAARMAAHAYEARDWAALPVLADALEDEGRADAELLSHLRSPGPHVRGCWALDLVLGRG
jgi:hypothetical protein